MKLVFSLVLLLAISCSTATQKIRDNQMVGGVCEKKFKDTNLHKGQIIWQKTGEKNPAGMSYLVTGLGNSSFVIVSFIHGIGEASMPKGQCPNVDDIAFGLVKVADCYQDMSQRPLARTQLQKITHSEVFKTCLSKDARSKIEKKLSSFPYK